MVLGVLRYAAIALVAMLVNQSQPSAQTPEQPASIQRHEWRVFTAANSDLPDNQVLALATGANGALWVATSGGLARFYSGDWRVFTAANSDLPDDSVQALAVGVDGAMWVGTRGGLARFDNGAWQIFTMADSGLPDDSVRALAQGADGAMWVGTSYGLARFHEGAWRVFTAANSDLPADRVLALAVGTDGALWVGTSATYGSGELARFKLGVWRVFNAANSDLPHGRVQTIAAGADGALWVGIGATFRSGGLARYHDGSFRIFTTANSDLPDDSVQALTVGAGGALWVGTRGGLARFAEGTWQVFTTANSDLPVDSVQAFTAGADGALWVGTTGDFTSAPGGLARLDEGAWQIFTATNSRPPIGSKVELGGANGYLPGNNIHALATSSDGVLWIGATGFLNSTDGLARFHEGTWQVFTAANSDLPNNSVQALVEGADGALRVGTQGGLARFDEGAWQVFTIANSDLPNNSVQALAEDADGALWVGTQGGLVRFDEGTWQVFTAANSHLPNNNVEALVQGADGALWVATLGGLAQFDEGGWKVFTAANSHLPNDRVQALVEGADGALWVGTLGGLARFHEGAWQVFTVAYSDLPNNSIQALVEGADGALWVGTASPFGVSGGLARFDWKRPIPVLSKIETLAEVHQSEHTFAVRGFDPTYRTPPHLLRFNWTVTRQDRFGTKVLLTQRTREPYLTVSFPEDGSYTIMAQASDLYGWLSNSETFEVKAVLPGNEEISWWQSTTAKVSAAAVPLLYLMLLLPLISLYPRFSWARSVVNSGVFTKFPVVHRLLLNSSWARNRLFALYRADAIGASDVAHYIGQSVFPLPGGESLPVGHEDDPLGGLGRHGRFSLILGRSGTGKSILMSRIRRTAAAKFGQAGADLPVLVNTPTHLAGGEALVDAIKTVLRRDGKVELPESILDFLIGKGGILVLVDSLNECPQADRALTSFLNSDANNMVIIASQTDAYHHPDVMPYHLAEITTDQARSYLNERIEAGTWGRLLPPLRALAHNPKDLDLIAEVIENLGVENLPSRRADLYAERLRADTAVKAWVDTADQRLEILYGLSRRMLAERRVVDLPTFAQWVKEQLAALSLAPEEVDTVTDVLRRSRQFRQVKTRDRLGREQEAITFDHELVGKFLAARQVRAMLESASRAEALRLATEDAWQDVFFFVIDEAGAPQLPKLLLDELIDQSGAIPLALVAYAIKTKSAELPTLPPEVREKYSEARLREDVKLTPAA